MRYRNEHKYVSPEGILRVQEARVSQLMRLDDHADAGGYAIRSVYFDDLYNTCSFLRNFRRTTTRNSAIPSL